MSSLPDILLVSSLTSRYILKPLYIQYSPFISHLAQHSVCGLLPVPIQEVSSRGEANQIFVDTVMGGRVYQHEHL